jgi:hypothetical protein
MVENFQASVFFLSAPFSAPACSLAGSLRPFPPTLSFFPGFLAPSELLLFSGFLPLSALFSFFSFSGLLLFGFLALSVFSSWGSLPLPESSPLSARGGGLLCCPGCPGGLAGLSAAFVVHRASHGPAGPGEAAASARGGTMPSSAA